MTLELMTAQKQEDRVLEIFRHLNKPLTPHEVNLAYNAIYNPSPVTSIRRAITDLTKEGKLLKTQEMKTGEFGKPTHTWVIK